MQQPYSLPEGVHFCSRPGGGVFLDIRRDRYFGLSEASARRLTDADCGYSVEVASLVSRGLLKEGEGRPVAAPVVVPVDFALCDPDEFLQMTITARHGLAFVRAFVTAAWLARWCSLDCIVKRVTRIAPRDCRQPGSLDLLRVLMGVFFRLRPLAYTKKNRCLLDSLVLIEFLTHFGFRPNFVIGVKPQPFAAHSWVQYDRYVLNGTVECVRAFTPILVI
jgi:hypothetical protein